MSFGRMILRGIRKLDESCGVPSSTTSPVRPRTSSSMSSSSRSNSPEANPQPSPIPPSSPKPIVPTYEDISEEEEVESSTSQTFHRRQYTPDLVSLLTPESTLIEDDGPMTSHHSNFSLSGVNQNSYNNTSQSSTTFTSVTFETPRMPFSVDIRPEATTVIANGQVTAIRVSTIRWAPKSPRPISGPFFRYSPYPQMGAPLLPPPQQLHSPPWGEMPPPPPIRMQVGPTASLGKMGDETTEIQSYESTVTVESTEESTEESTGQMVEAVSQLAQSMQKNMSQLMQQHLAQLSEIAQSGEQTAQSNGLLRQMADPDMQISQLNRRMAQLNERVRRINWQTGQPNGQVTRHTGQTAPPGGQIAQPCRQMGQMRQAEDQMAPTMRHIGQQQPTVQMGQTEQEQYMGQMRQFMGALPVGQVTQPMGKIGRINQSIGRQPQSMGQVGQQQQMVQMGQQQQMVQMGQPGGQIGQPRPQQFQMGQPMGHMDHTAGQPMQYMRYTGPMGQMLHPGQFQQQQQHQQPIRDLGQMPLANPWRRRSILPPLRPYLAYIPLKREVSQGGRVYDHRQLLEEQIQIQTRPQPQQIQVQIQPDYNNYHYFGEVEGEDEEITFLGQFQSQSNAQQQPGGVPRPMPPAPGTPFPQPSLAGNPMPPMAMSRNPMHQNQLSGTPMTGNQMSRTPMAGNMSITAIPYNQMSGMAHSQMSGMSHNQMSGMSHNPMLGMSQNHGSRMSQSHGSTMSQPHGSTMSQPHMFTNSQNHGPTMQPNQMPRAPQPPGYATPQPPLSSTPRMHQMSPQPQTPRTPRNPMQPTPLDLSPPMAGTLMPGPTPPNSPDHNFILSMPPPLRPPPKTPRVKRNTRGPMGPPPTRVYRTKKNTCTGSCCQSQENGSGSCSSNESLKSSSPPPLGHQGHANDVEDWSANFFPEPTDSDWVSTPIYHLDPEDGILRFKCCKCDNLVKHRSRKPTVPQVPEELTHACAQCDKKFATGRQLKVHQFRHGPKYYPCMYCEKPFLTRFERRSHEFTHTQNRTYSCPICPESFVHASARYLHVREMHKKYECEECFKKTCGSRKSGAVSSSSSILLIELSD